MIKQNLVSWLEHNIYWLVNVLNSSALACVADKTFWTLLRITMKPCGGCFRIRIFFPWSSTGYILLWHNGFILADLHGERCTNELQVQGEMHSQIRTLLFIPETGKQAALSWVISISVITHQHVHKQTKQKLTPCAHQQCGGKYWLSENQPATFKREF